MRALGLVVEVWAIRPLWPVASCRSAFNCSAWFVGKVCDHGSWNTYGVAIAPTNVTGVEKGYPRRMRYVHDGMDR